MNCDVPYLYHYTNLSSLESILMNRTIRLNSLANMDDLQEKETADVKELGRFVFVSSWTDESKESIPMWKMYATMDAGVRIALPPNPFKRKQTDGTRFAEVLGSHNVSDNGETKVDTFLDMSILAEKHCFSPEAWTGDILKQVEYVDDTTLLVPQVIQRDAEGTSIQFGKLGYHKSTHWSFESEWRYRMTFIPFNWDANPQYMLFMLLLQFQQFIKGAGDLPFDYFDLEIDDTVFKKMIITPSPQMTAENRKKLNEIVSQYNPDASVQESELLGRIKIK